MGYSVWQEKNQETKTKEDKEVESGRCWAEASVGLAVTTPLDSLG